jgi:hypothetical protein
MSDWFFIMMKYVCHPFLMVVISAFVLVLCIAYCRER